MGARAPSWAPPTPTHPQVPGVPFTEPLSSTPPPQAGEALNQMSGFRPTSCPHPQMQGVSPQPHPGSDRSGGTPPPGEGDPQAGTSPVADRTPPPNVPTLPSWLQAVPRPLGTLQSWSRAWEERGVRAVCAPARGSILCGQWGNLRGGSRVPQSCSTLGDRRPPDQQHEGSWWEGGQASSWRAWWARGGVRWRVTGRAVTGTPRWGEMPAAMERARAAATERARARCYGEGSCPLLRRGLVPPALDRGLPSSGAGQGGKRTPRAEAPT